MNSLRACLLAASMAAWPLVIAAQDLRGGADPTRPPAGVLPQGVSHAPSALEALLPVRLPPALRPAAEAPAAASAPDAASAASAPARPRNRLTSISLGDGVRTAIVDGKVRRPGDRVGPALLVSIDPEGVTLKGDKGLQRLWLRPSLHPSLSRGQADPATDTEGESR